MKAKQAYDDMESKLRAEGAREVSQLKARYETMIEELKQTAARDKEFVVNELKKEIAALEKKIEDLKA